MRDADLRSPENIRAGPAFERYTLVAHTIAVSISDRDPAQTPRLAYCDTFWDPKCCIGSCVVMPHSSKEFVMWCGQAVIVRRGSNRLILPKT